MAPAAALVRTALAWVLLIWAALAWPTTVFGHGVTHEVFGAGTGIRATYDDGSAMEYCDVAVISPADDGVEFQTGTTDRHGRFAFVPDTAGVWRVTVDDGMGHMMTVDVTVDSLGAIAAAPHDHGIGRLSGTVGGEGAILGLFGLWALLRGSKADE